MKKLALAIGLGAFVVFSASANSLAASRIDTASGVVAIRDSRIAWSVTGTSARLLFLNEALYPETTGTAAVTVSPGAHVDRERSDRGPGDVCAARDFLGLVMDRERVFGTQRRADGRLHACALRRCQPDRPGRCVLLPAGHRRVRGQRLCRRSAAGHLIRGLRGDRRRADLLGAP